MTIMLEAFKKGFESQLAICGELATFTTSDESFSTEVNAIKVQSRDVLSQSQFSTYADATFLRVPIEGLSEVGDVMSGDMFTLGGVDYAVKGTPEKIHNTYWNIEVYEAESGN